MGLAMVQTNLFETAGKGVERPAAFTFPDPDDAASDVQVMASVGGALPLWHLKQWPGKGGIVISAQVGITARFRIEYETREDAGQDWFVGMPIEVAYERWSGRFRIGHRSSHIGDELVETTGVQRIEFGGEFADFIAAYRLVHEVRAYGGATFNFRSYTEELPALRTRGWHDYLGFQAGIDGGVWQWSNGHVGWVGGIDWQLQQRTNWRSIYALALGVGARTETRGTRLLLRYYSGPSAMGEFFLTRERFWGLEWVVDF